MKNLLLLSLSCLVSANLALGHLVSRSDWSFFGSDVNDATFVGNGVNGGTMSFVADMDFSSAAGSQSIFDTPVTLVPGQTLQFDLTVRDVIMDTNNPVNVGFRIGFESDDPETFDFDATFHFLFSMGGEAGTWNNSSRFAGNSFLSNPFAIGTTFDTTLLTGANFLATDETDPAVISVGLTLVGVNEGDPDLFDYEAFINWDGFLNTTSTTFTRNSNSWNSAYVLTNTPLLTAIGNTYTFDDSVISVIPEPSSAGLLMSLLAFIGATTFVRRPERGR
ncbi:MAG: hypothetical protein AAGJ81_09250 [Verrucomicrobiota bacterium]